MQPESDVLTVMTLNIWNLNHWEERRDALAAWVNEVRPDLLALQEVVRTRDHCQATWIAEHTDMQAVFGRASGPPEREYGNAVLTRLAITDVRSLELSGAGGGSERRGIMSVDAATTRGTVTFSTTHLSHLFDEGWVREAQVVDIATFLGTGSTECPSILCGDLNARPDSTEVRFLKGLTTLGGRSFHLFDAFEVANPGAAGMTWDNRNPYAAMNQVPDQRIDYILVGVRASDGTGRIQSARLVCDGPREGAWPSDHFGVTATLAWGTSEAETVE